MAKCRANYAKVKNKVCWNRNGRWQSPFRRSPLRTSPQQTSRNESRVEKLRAELLDAPNRKHIRRLMKRTFLQRRAWITAKDSPTVATVNEQFPCLKESRYVSTDLLVLSLSNPLKLSPFRLYTNKRNGAIPSLGLSKFWWKGLRV